MSFLNMSPRPGHLLGFRQTGVHVGADSTLGGAHARGSWEEAHQIPRPGRAVQKPRLAGPIKVGWWVLQSPHSVKLWLDLESPCSMCLHQSCKESHQVALDLRRIVACCCWNMSQDLNNPIRVTWARGSDVQRPRTPYAPRNITKDASECIWEMYLATTLCLWYVNSAVTDALSRCIMLGSEVVLRLSHFPSLWWTGL